MDEGASHTYDGRQPFKNSVPSLPFIARAKELAASRAEIDSGGIKRIRGHGIVQNSFVSLLLRKPPCQRLPRFAAVTCSIDAQAAIARTAKLVGLDRNDVDAIRIPGMHHHGKTEIRGHAVGDVLPVLRGIVGAIYAQ